MSVVSGLACPQRKMQVLALKKAGLGTPTISGSCAAFCTIADNGVGDYTITFGSKVIFTQIPEIALGGKTVGILKIHAVTISTVQVKCFAVDGTTPAEMDFDLMAIGSLARDLQG